VEVGYTDRSKKYDTNFVKAEDRSDIRRFGMRKKVVKLPGIHNKELAQRVAFRLLIDSLYRFNTYRFTLTFNKMLLENGDVITLTDGELLTSQRCRIMQIDEDANGRGLSCMAVDDLAVHYPDVTSYQAQGSLYAADPTISLVDATVNFRENVTERLIHLSVTPGSAQFTGAYIWRSFDDVTYTYLGQFGVPGVTSGDANSAGTVTGFIPAHPAVTWAKDETILVSIGTVTDLDTSITDDDFWSDRKLAKIGNEIIAFKTAAETSVAGIWQISNLRRGLFGTEAVAHYTGETFCTLDPDFSYAFRQSDIGRTLYFKALVFYGTDQQVLSDVTGASVIVGGYADRPAAASLLRLTADENDGGGLDYSGATFTLYWNLGSRVSGFNYGPWDVSGSLVPWNHYIADAELEAIVLEFEQTDGTAIGTREIAVASSVTITKATDLGGFDDAVIKVIPRRMLKSRLENKITVSST
jgi:hypothetical protein